MTTTAELVRELNSLYDFMAVSDLPTSREEYLELRQQNRDRRELRETIHKATHHSGYETVLGMRGKAQNGM